MSDYNFLTDEDLVFLLKEGNGHAFTEIYNRYHALLYIYAHKKLNDKEEAQDIIQEVLTTIWNKRNDLPPQISLKSYLYTSVRNRAFDIFSHRKVEAKYIDSLQHFLNYSTSNTDYHIRENDLKRLIDKEIQQLPPRMREAFLLSRENLLTHREIAETMDLSQHTVTTQIKKALRILRVRLGIILFFLQVGLFEGW